MKTTMKKQSPIKFMVANAAMGAVKKGVESAVASKSKKAVTLKEAIKSKAAAKNADIISKANASTVKTPPKVKTKAPAPAAPTMQMKKYKK
jgi:hypothetical protein